MSTPRSRLTEYIEQGIIPAEKINTAFKAAQLIPDGMRWRLFIDYVLLWLGSLALAFAVMFFIAYNWHDIDRFAKFAMVESVIILAILAYWKFEEQSAASKASLFIATLSLGVLLALYGQTYQTGADPWQLFFNWALLIIPWVLIGRFPTLWIVWVTLLNISIILYYRAFPGLFGILFTSETAMLWLIFFFNTLVLVIWELLAIRRLWLSERWAIRLLATGSGVSLTWLVLFSIFDYQDNNGFSGLMWLVWLAAMYIIYRKIRPDLFMLAGLCLSGISVIVSYFAEHMLHHTDAGGFLFLALLVIILGGGSAFWLKQVHKEWHL